MPFTFRSFALEDVILIEPRVFPDGRGFFLESYKKSDFAKNGIDAAFVQDNHSYSQKNVLRGLHYQLPPMAQGKLVRVIKGAVLDVAVDIRKNSPTFLQWVSERLTAENSLMMYVPPGFAHGFLTLTDDVHLLYKCTDEYAPDLERGIRWDDPDINVDWEIENPLVSEKDGKLPFLANAEVFQ